ncbi:MAG TPA: hypothetical protein VF469_22120 [Kofleriaceae bacterium]
MNRTTTLILSPGLLLSAALAACQDSPLGEPIGIARDDLRSANDGTYNLHLEDTVRFNPIQPGSDPDRGRRLFGLAGDLEAPDASQALFQGPSQAFGGAVVSNGRTCFSCHRGVQATSLGLPRPPLSATIPLTDPVFTGLDGDAQGDPDGMRNLDQLGLLKYRPHRFNLARAQSDPFRKVFAWRKAIRLVNVAFSAGFLNDARGRHMFEVERGAVFSHTQDSDNRFDDLFTVRDGNDLQAFLFGILSDPRLAALRDPSDPMYAVLVTDPFYTVPIATQAQKRGSEVFRRNCMTCHNTPNVFNNVSNVEPLGSDTRPPNFPSFAPAVGRTFDVGVAERNRHGLRFTHDDGGGQFSPIVIPLANEDGSTNLLTVTIDLGLGAITGRTEDVGRFKVPQLRGVRNNAPYFHDDSAFSLEEVVDYFNSDHYNRSKDGSKFPIHLDASQRADLLAFLQIL